MLCGKARNPKNVRVNLFEKNRKKLGKKTGRAFFPRCHVAVSAMHGWSVRALGPCASAGFVPPYGRQAKKAVVHDLMKLSQTACRCCVNPMAPGQANTSTSSAHNFCNLPNRLRRRKDTASARRFFPGKISRSAARENSSKAGSFFAQYESVVEATCTGA